MKITDLRNATFAGAERVRSRFSFPMLASLSFSEQHRMRFEHIHLKRTSFSNISFKRIAMGGRVDDRGRLPRYILVLFLCIILIWVPIGLYISFAPRQYTSEISLILPGAGASTSINLSDIGQVSSSAVSAYSSSTLSPTVTYKNLLESTRVLEGAAVKIGEKRDELKRPIVRLLDQTSFIQVSVVGNTPEQAQQRATAILNAFHSELDKLRIDEIRRREESTTETIAIYQKQVDVIREKTSKLQAVTNLNSREEYNSFIVANNDLKEKIAATDAVLKQLNDKITSLSASLQITPERAIMSLKLRADPIFMALQETLAKDNALLAELSSNLGSNHPRFLMAKARVTGTRNELLNRAITLTKLSNEAIEEEISSSADTERTALMSQLVTLVAEKHGQEAVLESQRETLAQDEEKVHKFADTVVLLDTLNNDSKVAEAVFASALARINTSKIDIFASYPMVQIAEPPTLPERPSSPKVLIAVVSGFVASFFLFIAFGMAWIRRSLIVKLLKYTTDGRGNGKP